MYTCVHVCLRRTMSCDCGYAFVSGVCPDVRCIFDRGALIPALPTYGVTTCPRTPKDGEAYRGDVFSQFSWHSGHGGSVGSVEIVRGKGDHAL